MNLIAEGELASWLLWGGNAKTVRFTSITRRLASEKVPRVFEDGGDLL